jgi:hypothetical protein
MFKLFENTGVGVAAGGGILAMMEPNTGTITTASPKLREVYRQWRDIEPAHKCDEMAEIRALLLTISEKLEDKPNG